jgi:hypothetical protein
MRDKARIEPLLDKIKAFWLDNQDLRFGQVVYMLAENLNCHDIFFPEDKEWDKAIDKLIEQSCVRYKKCECDKDSHDCEGCKHDNKTHLELPCMICCGAELKGLNGYTRNCYFK